MSCYHTLRITATFICLLFIAMMNAQVPFDKDSVVLIAALENVDEVLMYDGSPYTGEAFFLNAESHMPMVMRSYVDGKQEGVWRTWHSNGHLYKEGFIANGKEDGRYLEYFESGILCYEYFYDMGLKTGRWRSWYESGDLYTERNFKNGNLHGRLVHYDESGEALVTEDYEDGRVIASTRNKNPRRE